LKALQNAPQYFLKFYLR